MAPSQSFASPGSPKASGELPHAWTSFWQRSYPVAVAVAKRHRKANHKLAAGLTSSQTLVNCGMNRCLQSHQTVEGTVGLPAAGLTQATSFLWPLEMLGEIQKCPRAAPVPLPLAEERIAYVEVMLAKVFPVASPPKDFPNAFGSLMMGVRSVLMVVELG
mmetsp:Transcript_85887/g.152122  ORF Transcript_85887/g.152122 Transcript_85887/m.152122 type:complete len:160 (-) Transcript_85887:2855-3334(-)